MKLKKCFGFSLRTATIVLACFFAALTFTGIVLTSMKIASAELDEAGWKGIQGNTTQAQEYLDRGYGLIQIAELLMGLITSSMLMYLVSLCLLIYGSISRKPCFLWPCMGITALAIFTILLFEIFSIINASITGHELSIIVSVFGLIITGIFCYFELVLYSYEDDMRISCL